MDTIDKVLEFNKVPGHMIQENVTWTRSEQNKKKIFVKERGYRPVGLEDESYDDEFPEMKKYKKQDDFREIRKKHQRVKKSNEEVNFSTVNEEIDYTEHISPAAQIREYYGGRPYSDDEIAKGIRNKIIIKKHQESQNKDSDKSTDSYESFCTTSTESNYETAKDVSFKDENVEHLHSFHNNVLMSSIIKNQENFSLEDEYAHEDMRNLRLEMFLHDPDIQQHPLLSRLQERRRETYRLDRQGTKKVTRSRQFYLNMGDEYFNFAK